jgi:predicted lipoprotein with Yx(FWY)xxD motif
MNLKTLSTASVAVLALGASFAVAGSNMSGNMGSNMTPDASSGMGSQSGSDQRGSMQEQAGSQMDGDMQNGVSDGMGAMARAVNTGKFDGQVYLMDADLMTLYTFAGDKRGVSNCNGGCADNWPPLLGQPGMDLPRRYSLIKRADGTYQIAYKKMPLYRWMKDTNPGDMNGEGVKGVWFMARP